MSPLPKNAMTHIHYTACVFSQYLQALNQADFLAYSSIFAGYGNGGSGVDFIEESHKQVQKAITNLEDMIKIIEE